MSADCDRNLSFNTPMGASISSSEFGSRDHRQRQGQQPDPVGRRHHPMVMKLEFDADVDVDTMTEKAQSATSTKAH